VSIFLAGVIRIGCLAINAICPDPKKAKTHLLFKQLREVITNPALNHVHLVDVLSNEAEWLFYDHLGFRTSGKDIR